MTLYSELRQLPRETRLEAFHRADRRVRQLRDIKANGGSVTVRMMAKAITERKVCEAALIQVGGGQ